MAKVDVVVVVVVIVGFVRKCEHKNEGGMRPHP
jgi:hypothetical protein